MKRAAKSQASGAKAGKKSKKQREESRRKGEMWANEEAAKAQAKKELQEQQMQMMMAGGNGNANAAAARAGGRVSRAAAAAAAAAASSPGTVRSPPRMTRQNGGRSPGTANKKSRGAMPNGNKDKTDDADQQQDTATATATPAAVKKTSVLRRLVSFMISVMAFLAMVAVAVRLVNDAQLKDVTGQLQEQLADTTAQLTELRQEHERVKQALLAKETHDVTGKLQEQLADTTAQLTELRQEHERVKQALAAKETHHRAELAERDNMLTVARQELEVAQRPETWCRDAHEECELWASVEGECERNPRFMYLNCRRTCGACHPTE